MSEKRDFKAGEYIMTSEGEYSDYCVGGMYKVLNDFNIRETLKMWPVMDTDVNLVFNGDGSINKYESKFGPDSYGWDFESRFFSFLADHGFLESIDYEEVHIGDYGDINI
ncbi:hypothetical protein [Vibrio phage PJN101]|nr:hypothetical protein [Vibrio phage PJN101]